MNWLGSYRSPIGDLVSRWQVPTTADVGIRAFAATPSSLFREATLGMQEILLSTNGSKEVDSFTRKNGVWSIRKQSDMENTLVEWLEEVLFRAEVEGQWLVDCLIQIGDERLDAQVSYVDESLVEREVEIKAVTRHELEFRHISAGEMVSGIDEYVPEFEGPGWMANVIFDI